MTKFLTPETRFQSYMIFPRFLLECPISETAKLLYVLLLDRARISVKSEEWIDRHGHVFLNFTITDMAKALHKSEMTVKNCLNALEKEDLIARKRQETGKPNRIYVKIQGNEAAMGISKSIHETDRETPEEEMQADNQAEKAEAINRERELSVKGTEKYFPGGQRMVPLKDSNLSARKTGSCLWDRQETVSYGDRKLSGNKNNKNN